VQIHTRNEGTDVEAKILPTFHFPKRKMGRVVYLRRGKDIGFCCDILGSDIT
jgi:hypothetical protein